MKATVNFRILRAGIPCALILLAAGELAAQDFPAGPRPVATAHTLNQSPVVDDNVLDDPAWNNLEPITGFVQTQPNSGQPATQRTEVFVGYTDDAIYIGVVAFDDDPAAISATDSRRDSSLNDTDSFKVLIDGLMDRQNGFVFGTNPASVEFDGQVNREGASANGFGNEGGLNTNWDAPWRVVSSVSDIGWSSEFMIPFSSLRY